MINKRLNNASIFLLLILFFIFILFYFLETFPYLYNNYPYLVGFDAGEYVFKTESLNLDFWDDPILFFLSNLLSKVIDISVLEFYKKFFPLLTGFLLTISTFLLTKGIYNKKYSIAFACFLTIISLILLKAFYFAFFKQICATILLLNLIIFIRKIKEEYNLSSILLIGILFSSIFLMHKGIALFSLIFLMISFLNINGSKKSIKKMLLILSFIILLISPYLIIHFFEYIKTLTDMINLSFQGIFSHGEEFRKIAGRNIITDTTNINPIIALITSNPFLFIISIFSLFYEVISIKKFKKNVNRNLIILIFIMFLWVGLKFNFSNRLLINLGLFLLMFFPILYLNDKLINLKKVKITLIFCLILIVTLNSISLAKDSKPYLTKSDLSLKFIKENIPLRNSIIFSSDYIQTILAQEGYLVSQNYFPLDINLSSGLYVDKLSMIGSDNFLLTGFNNISYLKDYNLTNFSVYVIIGDWETKTNLPRATIDSRISLEKWDSSIFWERIYKGEDEIVRVYKLKNDTIN